MTASLANELGALRSEVLGIAKLQRPLTRDESANIGHRLQLLQRLATAMEQELAVHRLAEATGRRVMVMNDEAVTALAEMIEDPEGKIIRPDFGRDKP
jgi:type II secretory pathway predicted ATPase ExeA